MISEGRCVVVYFHVVMSDVQDGIDLFMGFYAVTVRLKLTLKSQNKQTFFYRAI
jgi:hypothetical protein